MEKYFSFTAQLSLFLFVTIVNCKATVENEPSGYGDHVDQGLIEILVRRIDGLEKQVEQQAQINRQQAETNYQQAVVIGQLQHKLDAVGEELAALKSSQDDAHEKPEDSDTDDVSTNSNPPKQATRRELMGSETVAFTAYLDHNLAHLGIDHTIVYNKVILNEGGAYNNNTGIFTCPYDGIYVFNFHVSSAHVQQIVAKLVVDNVNMVDGIADTYHQNQEAQGGNYVTLSLRAGQSVWVANYRYADRGDSSSNTYRFSTFSGHLIL